jgi:two-component system, OmpR family, aerobic respiration control sensor histidine kinase ArcB
MNSTDKLKKRIKELELKNEQLVSLLDNIPGSIYWKDKKGVYLGRNQYAADKTFEDKITVSKDKNLAIGKTDYDFLPKDVADQYRKYDMECMKTGKILEVEEYCVLHDGKRLAQLSQKRPWKNKDGEIIGVIGNTIDITDRKQAEKLRSEKEMAEKFASFANMLAGSIAHELRTPLCVIQCEMDVLSLIFLSDKNSQQEKYSAFKKALKTIKKTIADTTHVITDMLIKIKGFASGQIEGVFEHTPIISDIEEVLSFYPFEKGEEKIIKTNYDDRFQYLGDAILTRHVLTNLIKNALRAIKEEGKGKITTKLKTGVGKDKFNYLILKDTASGIPEDFLPKLFNQFETKKSTSGGTGLGLSFCKMVMQSYKGDIMCRSKKGEYTEFVLSFPKL